MTKQMSQSGLDKYYATFQPICTADGAGICGVEALARYKTATGDVLSPSQFRSNPLLSKEPLLLFKVMLAQAEALFKEVSAITDAPFFISVNFGSKVLNEAGVEDLLLEYYRNQRHQLKLEISEVPFIDSIEDVCARLLHIQCARNLTFALDDFGTEHSDAARYSYLSDAGVEIDTIKIDISLMPSVSGSQKATQDMLENAGLPRILGMSPKHLTTFVIEGAVQSDIRFYEKFLGSQYKVLPQTHYFHRPMSLESIVNLIPVRGSSHSK